MFYWYRAEILLRCAFFFFNIIHFSFSPCSFFRAPQQQSVRSTFHIFLSVCMSSSSLRLCITYRTLCKPVCQYTFARCIHFFFRLYYHLPTSVSAHAFIAAFAQILICAIQRRHLWNIKITRNRNEMIGTKYREGSSFCDKCQEIWWEWKHDEFFFCNEERLYAIADIAS